LQEFRELRPRQRLLLQERLGDAVEHGTVLRQQAYSVRVGVVRQVSLLAVAQPLRLLRKGVVVGAHRP
jgi:hypothetical protein